MGAAIGLGACSDSVASTDTTPSTTPCVAPSSPDTGASAGRVVPVNGTGDRSVGLPAGLTLPLRVHAVHRGRASFVVHGVDAAGKDTTVLAAARGVYEGTFAVGFIDPCANPTVALDISTTGPWHLDITEASNAPRIAGGVAGKGDAVFVYTGKATPATATYTGHADTRFDVTAYGKAGPAVLVSAHGPFHGAVSLPDGTVFVTVVADGPWTIRPS